MILIPEIETVVILVPRTGSGSLRRAIAARYPQSMMIYRHMEADGVPRGYDRWRRVGVVREPLARLWSLYKFMAAYKNPAAVQDQAYVHALNRSVERPFSDWIVNNETVFTSPYDAAGLGRYWPGFTVNHSLPENRKSQFLYLRPDLGTEVYGFEYLAELLRDLDLQLDHHNATSPTPAPPVSAEAAEHVAQWFGWDIAACDAIRNCRPMPDWRPA